MATQKFTYIGKGKASIGPYDGNGPMVRLGNCSQLDLTVAEDAQSVDDYTEAGGGEYDAIRRIKAVNMAATMWDLSPANLSRHLRGTSAEVSAAEVVDEQHTGYKGGIIALDNIPDPDETLTVTPAVGSGSFVEGTDYLRSLSGIEVLSGGSITDGDLLSFDYTKLPSTLIQVLTQTPDRYKLLFEGLNEADSGKPVIVKGHCIRLGALDKLPLIGSEFASITVNGDVLKDPQIVLSGLSKYFTVNMAK